MQNLQDELVRSYRHEPFPLEGFENRLGLLLFAFPVGASISFSRTSHLSKTRWSDLQAAWLFPTPLQALLYPTLLSGNSCSASTSVDSKHQLPVLNGVSEPCSPIHTESLSQEGVLWAPLLFVIEVLAPINYLRNSIPKLFVPVVSHNKNEYRARSSIYCNEISVEQKWSIRAMNGNKILWETSS